MIAGYPSSQKDHWSDQSTPVTQAGAASPSRPSMNFVKKSLANARSPAMPRAIVTGSRTETGSGPADDRDSAPYVPKGVVVDSAFTWGDDRPPRVPWSRTLIYECHVKGMTALHPAVPQQVRGTYLGFAWEPVIEHLLNTACGAPSVGNSQPWRFIRLASPHLRREILSHVDQEVRRAGEIYEKSEQQEYTRLKLHGLAQAPEWIVVYCDEASLAGRGLGRQTMPETLRYSTVMAIHTLWLAARARGLGLGWVSILDPVAATQQLQVPPHWSLVAYLCLGWPIEDQVEPELQQRGWQSREAACRQVGHHWRERQLGPVTTVKLFLLQILFGNVACPHVPRLAGKDVSGSAYCDARARLPLAAEGAAPRPGTPGSARCPPTPPASRWCSTSGRRCSSTTT